MSFAQLAGARAQVSLLSSSPWEKQEGEMLSRRPRGLLKRWLRKLEAALRLRNLRRWHRMFAESRGRAKPHPETQQLRARAAGPAAVSASGRTERPRLCCVARCRIHRQGGRLPQCTGGRGRTQCSSTGFWKPRPVGGEGT